MTIDAASDDRSADTPVATPGRPPLSINRYVPAMIGIIANQWSRSASTHYRRNFGIGIVEWRLMVVLAAAPWITAAQVDEMIGMDKAAVSRSVRELQKLGAVTLRPDEADPRRREMALTEAGRALYDRVVVAAIERERRALSCLTPEECQVLVDLLGRLQRNMAAIDAAPDPPPGA